MSTTSTPVADRLAAARANLDKATVAAKLAAAKRARLAAEVRALTAEAEIESMRIQARADRERADAAEAARARENAAHLAEEREHAEEIARLKQQLAQKRPQGRKSPSVANGYATTAEPRHSAAGRMAMLTAVESPDLSASEPAADGDRQATPDSAQQPPG